LLKFSKKIQPEAETCEVSVQMVKGWRSFKQLKTGAYNQKCQATLIILFPEGNSFPSAEVQNLLKKVDLTGTNQDGDKKPVTDF